MASINSSKPLLLLVTLAIISNFVVSALAVSRVRKSAKDYVITEEAFSRAVFNATTNFLSRVSLEESVEETQDIQVNVRYVEGLTIYYRPVKRQWVIRYNGCDFLPGDYFDFGVIHQIVEGRAYCRASDGSYSVIRPKLASEVSRLQPGRADAEEDGKELRL